MNINNIKKRYLPILLFPVLIAFLYPDLMSKAEFAFSKPGLGTIGLSIGTLFMIYALLALSQDVVLGRAGVYDMGHMVYFGMGAYVFAICITKYNMGFFLACTLACFIPAGLAFLLSVIALHLKGDYFLLVSIGYNIIFSQILKNNPFGLTNGPNGIFGIYPDPFLGFDLTSPRLIYYYGLIVLLIVIWLLHNFDNSRYGRAVFYMHQDELAALSMGVNPYFLKLVSFMFSGILAGFAGVLFALEYSSVNVEMCTINQSILLFAIVIVGGQGSLIGVLLGTFVMFILPEIIRDFAQVRFLVFGLLMVVLMIVRPHGLVPIKFGFYPKKFFTGGQS